MHLQKVNLNDTADLQSSSSVVRYCSKYYSRRSANFTEANMRKTGFYNKHTVDIAWQYGIQKERMLGNQKGRKLISKE